MKETSELLVFLTKVILKTLHNQKDGFQLKDLLEYIEHLKDAPQAFIGLKNIKPEFINASTTDIYTLTEEIHDLIHNEIDDDILCETIVNTLQTLLFTYAVLAKKNKD
jgi:hypothetical protein